MPNTRFDEFFNILMKLEGGYSNNPKDSGGPTYKGITLKSWRDYKNDQNATFDNIQTEDIKAFYRKMYFDAVPAPVGDELHYNFFDMAVNSGLGNARKMILANPTIKNVYDYREQFFREIVIKNASQLEFLPGWLNRLYNITRVFNNKNAGEKLLATLIKLKNSRNR